MRNCLFALTLALLLLSCKEESITQTNSNTSDFSNDYFPFTRSYTWTYSTNALSDSGKSVSSFEMRIDTTRFRNGVFWALMGRLSGTTQWGGIFAVKDSGGIVYSIGDNPPEAPFPLFKHQYLSNEGVPETISVSGTTYESVKVNFDFQKGRTLSLWLVKGIGLVKESSNQGVSLFTDDNAGKNVLIQTALVKVQK